MSRSPEGSAQQRLAFAMHTLSDRADFHSHESLAKRLNCHRTTVRAILLGERLPAKEFVCRLVDVCVEDATGRERYRAELCELWESAKAEKREMRRPSGSWQPGMPQLEATGFEELLPVTWYENNSEFYSAATECAKATRERIRVTYVRQVPPNHVTSLQAGKYFDTVLDFAREPGTQEVTRIIGAPIANGTMSEPMLDWMRNHHEETERIHNYEARVVRWMSGGDGLNMALFDDDTSFLAVSGQGGRQHLSGFKVINERFTDYLARYFDQLWTTLEPLGRFLHDYHK